MIAILIQSSVFCSDPFSPSSDSFHISRMLLNQSADWSRGEINVMPGLIEFFWTPDIIIYDLVRSVVVSQTYFTRNYIYFSFTKPKMLNEVAALEIIQDHSVYYKVR